MSWVPAVELHTPVGDPDDLLWTEPTPVHNDVRGEGGGGRGREEEGRVP